MTYCQRSYLISFSFFSFLTYFYRIMKNFVTKPFIISSYCLSKLNFYLFNPCHINSQISIPQTNWQNIKSYSSKNFVETPHHAVAHIPVRASDAKYLTSVSASSLSLSNTGLTCEWRALKHKGSHQKCARISSPFCFLILTEKPDQFDAVLHC